MLRRFTKDVYRKPLNNPTTALANGVLPASGSFIDSRTIDAETITFEIHLGTLADALTFKVRQDTSATQTAIKDIDTNATVISADNHDGHLVQIEVPKSKLDNANGFYFLTVAISGVSGSNYGALSIAAINASSQPVTNPATVHASLV